MEIDCRGLNFAGWPKGEVADWMPGLVTEDDRPLGPKGAAANGNGLLEAEDVGRGGEKGCPGWWLDCIWLALEGETDGRGLGSSSWLDTPRARSFASLRSST